MHRTTALSLLLALACSACTVCARPETRPDRASTPGFTLVFTAGQVGYLEPCGCSPDQRGGVARAATVIEEIRAAGPVLLVDGGDRFFPVDLPQDELALRQTRLQADAMVNVTRALGYDALTLTDRDQEAGTDLFANAALPPLLDAGEKPTPGTQDTVIKEVGGVRVGLFAVGSGHEAAASLSARAAALKKLNAQVIVGIVYRPVDGTRALAAAAKEAGVDFLLSSRADVPDVHDPAALADLSPPIFSPNARGEGLLRLDVVAGGRPGQAFVKVAGTAERESELDAIQQRIENMRRDVTSLAPADPARALRTDKLLELEARKAKLANAPPPPMPADANAFTYAFVPMTPQLPQQPKVRALIDAYDRNVAEQNLAWAKANPKPCPAPAPGAPSFVGDTACVGCHAAAFEFWKGTSHARAYTTLEQKGKQYNLDCVSCHVTGWEKPGGACSIAQVEGRTQVQCESCHGAGSLHARTGDPSSIARQVPDATCRGCHDPENSPHFNPTPYRTRILGPGHGASVD